MVTVTRDPIADMLSEEAKSTGRAWGWLLAFAIVHVVTGVLAVGFAVFATLASVVVLGILLLIAAVAQIGAAIWAWDWKGFFLFLLLGVLYAVTGSLAILNPAATAEALTLMLAAAFLVAGIFRTVVALAERFPSWGWVFCGGIVNLLLGLAILRHWPGSGLWALGLFVGVELIISGAIWTTIAVEVRNEVARGIGD